MYGVFQPRQKAGVDLFCLSRPYPGLRMIADTIERPAEGLETQSGSLQFKVTRGYRETYFIVEDAENLMKIVAGPFSSARQAMDVLRLNTAQNEIALGTGVLARIL